jgi:hypothetical protein
MLSSIHLSSKLFYISGFKIPVVMNGMFLGFIFNKKINFPSIYKKGKNKTSKSFKFI